jgi:predicted nuclease of predicted toxin-antitoxin system
MRFLANAGVSPKTVDFLKQLGHEAVHVRTLGLERASDRLLIDRAIAQYASAFFAVSAVFPC